MGIEYECRILDVNVKDLIQRCKELGADYMGTYWQKRLVYDFKPVEKGRWIRLRSNGKITTLAIKEIKSSQISGTKELEVEVSDFEITKEIMQKLGYLPRTYQENYRIEYTLNGVNIDIDKWPEIPWYVEIEGKDEKSVLEMVKKLGFSLEDVITLDVDAIYEKNYGLKLDNINQLCFSKDEIEKISTYERN